MSRKSRTVAVPTTFVGTFYDVTAGVYVATRKDGSLTVGRIGSRGLNITGALTAPDARSLPLVQH